MQLIYEAQLTPAAWWVNKSETGRRASPHIWPGKQLFTGPQIQGVGSGGVLMLSQKLLTHPTLSQGVAN